jgi:hypothetical protein
MTDIDQGGRVEELVNALRDPKCKTRSRTPFNRELGEDFGLKLCTTCDSVKQRSDFHTNNGVKKNGKPRVWDGLQAYCKACKNAADNAKYAAKRLAGLCMYSKCKRPAERGGRCFKHAEMNSRSTRKSARKAWANSPEYRARNAASCQQRRAATLKAYSVDDYIGATHEERAALKAQHHVAIDSGRKGIIGFIRKDVRQALRDLEVTKQLASTFTPDDPMVLDHRIPLQPREGEPAGTHSLNNLGLLKASLNSAKSNRTLQELLYNDPETWAPYYFRTNEFEDHTVDMSLSELCDEAVRLAGG